MSVASAIDPVVALIDNRHFVLATRDTGYRGLEAAIGELVDNALQARATDIQVAIQHVSPEDRRAGFSVIVMDNGVGMSPSQLRRALQFGGTDRFGDRSGLGRFGMGLPNGSVSQARRVDVFSRQSGYEVAHTYLDVDEIAGGALVSIPEPTIGAWPSWVPRTPSTSGTLVVWTRCDRIAGSRLSAITRRLSSALSRLYRYAFWNGVSMTVNGRAVNAFDPLFLRRNDDARSTTFGQPLKYLFRSPRGVASAVEALFTILPVERCCSWVADEKRKQGIVGGAGVSIVRAGREIDYGWYFFGAKRRENYDDWWRCEVRFEPELDELFGVTHSKQGITPSADLRTVLGSDFEAIARMLNARVRQSFERVKNALPSVAAVTAGTRDQFLPPIQVARRAKSVSGLSYRIEVKSLGSPGFFDVTLVGGTLVLTLNKEHVFYSRIYEEARRDPSGAETIRLEALLLAAARSYLDVQTEHDKKLAERLRQSWGDALTAYLEK